MGQNMYALKNCLLLVGPSTRANIRFPGPIPVHDTNIIRIGLAVFAGLAVVSDRRRSHTMGHVSASRDVAILQNGVARCHNVANRDSGYI